MTYAQLLVLSPLLNFRQRFGPTKMRPNFGTLTRSFAEEGSIIVFTEQRAEAPAPELKRSATNQFRKWLWKAGRSFVCRWASDLGERAKERGR